MSQLPLAEPGVPNHRSPARYLWWVARGQTRTMIGGMAFGIAWMAGQALIPALLGRAIDEGIAALDSERLLHWTALLFAVGAVQAVAGIMRHRFAVTNWLTGGDRTGPGVAPQSAGLGATPPEHPAPRGGGR